METLHELVIDQLKELYSAETQLKILIEKMAYQTANEGLRHRFEKASKDMDLQTTSLDHLFSLFGVQKGQERFAHIMEAIGTELQSFIDLAPGSEVRDAAFIAIFQKARHYQIAMYGTLKQYAVELRNAKAEKVLEELLAAKKEDDREFSQTARQGINRRAMAPDAEHEAPAGVSEH
ncbi:MAG TPA: DUF892 family protein [Chryseosolibacter sp.]|nr:DUF892 family protein [Chryseosolibacter sp.]